jgi:hypothetical protein
MFLKSSASSAFSAVPNIVFRSEKVHCRFFNRPIRRQKVEIERRGPRAALI